MKSNMRGSMKNFFAIHFENVSFSKKGRSRFRFSVLAAAMFLTSQGAMGADVPIAPFDLSSTEGSLRNFINSSISNGDEIVFSEGNYLLTSNNGTPISKNNLSFLGKTDTEGNLLTTLDGGTEFNQDGSVKTAGWQLLRFSSATSFSIKNLSIENMKASSGQPNGGAISVEGDYSGLISGSVFSHNIATKQRSGGGVLYVVGDFDGAIDGSKFIGNTADFGGAVFVWNNFNADISNSVFYKNIGKQGAGVIQAGSVLPAQGVSGDRFTGKVINSVFAENSGTLLFAGAISGVQLGSQSSAVDFGGSRFFNNSTNGTGGAFDFSVDMNLIAESGDLIFAGNIDHLSNGAYPNAFYDDNDSNGATVSLAALKGKNIYFYDPIASSQTQDKLALSLNATFDSTGAVDGKTKGNIVFDGGVGADGQSLGIQSKIYFSSGAEVYGGKVILQNGAILGADDNIGTLTVAPGATYKIAYEQPSPERKADMSVYTSNDGTVNMALDSSHMKNVAWNPSHIARINGNLAAQNANLEFVLPREIQNGNTLSEVSESANVDGAKVIVSVAGNKTLQTFGKKVGDYLNLIKANSMTGTPVSLVEVKESFALRGIYKASVEDGTTLVIRQTSLQRKNPAMTFPESWLGGMNFLNMGSDFLADQGMRTMLDAGKMREGVNAFGVVGGGSLKASTDDGYVKTRGLNLLAGAAYRKGCRFGICDGGVFLEYGRGNYSSETTPMMTLDASGDLHYAGIGVMGRMEFRHSDEERQYAWAEGSLRMGRLTHDYDSSDVDITFNASAMYLGAYLGGGYWLTPSSHTRLDAYGKFFWNRIASKHINADDGTDDGISVNFHAVNSMRARVGGLLYYDTGSEITPYAGLAYEYAFGGKAKSDSEDMSIAAPALKGSVGIGEVGFRCEPKGFKKDLLIDLSATGYTGKRQGVVGVLKLRYRF
jgi:hypothetical protein